MRWFSGSRFLATNTLRRSTSLVRARAKCVDALGVEQRPVTLLERQRGLFHQPEQTLVDLRRQPGQRLAVGLGVAQSRSQPFEGLDLVPGIAQLVRQALVVNPWPHGVAEQAIIFVEPRV